MSTPKTIIHSDVLFGGESTSSTDKNIELNKIAQPTDTNADGGGITLKGTSDKTFNWVDSTGAWTSSEHLDLAPGKTLKLRGSTSGSITLNVPAESGTQTLTLPAITGTLVTTDGNVASATNIADGSANQIPYQSATSTTTFVPAPSESSTYLQWTGASFAWAEVPVERTFVIATRTEAVNIIATSGALTVYGRISNTDVVLSL